MLVFAHTGLTLGAAVLLAGVAGQGWRGGQAGKAATAARPAALLPRIARGAWSRLHRLEALVDVRLLLLGAMLPDIMDKPAGQWLWRDALSNGRAFTHTLLFVLLALGLALFAFGRSRSTGLLALSFGSLVHLVLDGMWRFPTTLFWPVLGLAFPRGNLSDWLLNNLRDLVTDPTVYVPEALGLLIMGWFAWTLWRRRTIRRFLVGERPHASTGAPAGEARWH